MRHGMGLTHLKRGAFDFDRCELLLGLGLQGNSAGGEVRGEVGKGNL